jgi:hypothetical protein
MGLARPAAAGRGLRRHRPAPQRALRPALRRPPGALRPPRRGRPDPRPPHPRGLVRRAGRQAGRPAQCGHGPFRQRRQALRPRRPDHRGVPGGGGFPGAEGYDAARIRMVHHGIADLAARLPAGARRPPGAASAWPPTNPAC